MSGLDVVGAALPATGSSERFTTELFETMREQIAPEATPMELTYFAGVCNRLQLSPFADQILLIGRWDKRVRRKVHRHQITVTGRRTLASRSGRLTGIDGPVWCGPRESRTGGELRWREVWDDDSQPPYCARVLVHVAGWVVPANGTTKWSEFAQTVGDGDDQRLAGLWAQMPSHMLGKCAESLALRRAFPDILTAAVVDGFAEAPDLDSEVAAEAAAVSPGGAGSPRIDPERIGRMTAQRSTGSDQGAAHRIIADLPEVERDAWLARWSISMREVWPTDAVADALSGSTGAVSAAGDAPADPDSEVGWPSGEEPF